MASIDLPRALQDYFAFAETTPTRNGRRFSITLPYIRPDGRLDRLQWWYHLSAAKEMALGDGASDTLRMEAVERFCVHIGRWLHNTRQDLYGNGAIPHVSIEGNRVVAAYQVDASTSEGLAHNEDDEVTDAVASNQDDAQVEEAGGDTSAPGTHLESNKSAFG
jgi:hypothetical protein